MSIALNYPPNTHFLIGFRRCNAGSAVSLVGSHASIEVRNGPNQASTLVKAFDDTSEGGIYLGGTFGEASGVIWWWIQPSDLTGYVDGDKLYFTLILRDSLGNLSQVEYGYLRIIQQTVEDTPGSNSGSPPYPASLPAIPTDFTGVQLIVSDDLIASIAHVAGPAGAQGAVGPTVVPPLNLRLVYPDDDGYAMTIFPDPDVDTESEPFFVTGLSLDNPDLTTKNFVVRFGHNLAAGGGPVDAAKAMVGRSTEARYYFASGGFYASEVHDEFQRPGGTLQRYISAFLGHAAPTRDNNKLGLNIEQLFHEDTSFRRIFTSDRTDGFVVNDARIAVGIYPAVVGGNPASDGFVAAAPSDYTGKFLKLSRNGFEFATITSFGELVIDGSSSGLNVAGTAADAVLEITGRTQTPNIVNFRSVNGTERFRIAATGTQMVFNASVGHYFLKDFFVMDSTFTFNRFVVLSGSGQIWTNQATAGAPVSAPTNKIGFYDENGNFMGYAALSPS